MAPKKTIKTTKKLAPRKRKSQSKIWLAIVLIAVIVISVGVYATLSSQVPAPTGTYPATNVLLQTSEGNITISLRTDKPITDANFVNLVKAGKYDGTTFHRTMATFMIQGGNVPGDTTSIKDEIGSNNHNTKYTIAMAKTSAPNSATSEFFINTADNSQIVYSDGTRFDATYTVFGTVTAGTDVVDHIANAAVTADPNTGEMSVPVTPVTIIHATIVP
jgi:cyclophilin family peptidyl-prolyl cis-trans isomerase